MMMLMGGGLIFLLLVGALLLVGLMGGATLLGAGGSNPLERLRSPEPPVVGGDDPSAVRYCSQCRQPLQRGWAYCPGCGATLHWE